MEGVEPRTASASRADKRSATTIRPGLIHIDRPFGILAVANRWVRAPGLVAALVATTAAGIADGALTFLRSPADVRTFDLFGAVLFHCAAMLVPVGVVLGLVQEVVIHTVARHPGVQKARTFLKAGPKAWFETDTTLSARVFAAASGGFILIILVLQCVSRVTARIRDPALLALAVVGGLAVAATCTIFASFVAERIASRVFRRASSFASPVAVIVGAGLLFAWPLRVAFDPYHSALLTLGSMASMLLLVGTLTAAIDAAILVAFSTHSWFRAKANLLTVVSAACALGMLTVSGITLGRDQAVFSTVLLRSVAARHLVGPLQQLVDRDGDGFGAWFGGGDCDDRDRGRNPTAVDVPGNRIDENCSGNDASAAGTSQRPVRPPVAAPNALASVLLVSVDAMRPDHMSVYGYRRPTTPNLARFAERAVRFTEAYTTSPQSVRSMASVMTGRHAASLAWRPDPRFPQLGPTNSTLAEELRARGYATAAFLNTSYFSLTAGFFQGFELVQEGALFKDDERAAVSRAVTWLDERRRNEEAFFAWVHIINPHAPYGDRTTPEDFGHDDVARYDEELASTDAALDALLGVLERLERDGHPVLTVVFSDHGEAFGEHGHVNHGDCLHDEVLRVPLLIRVPGAPSAETRALVSLLDLHATVTSFTGVAGGASPSRSLMSLILSPETCRNRPLCNRESLRAEVSPNYGSTASVRALVVPPWKLIHDVEHGAWELYNRNLDRSERSNVYDASPARAAQLRTRLLDSVD